MDRTYWHKQTSDAPLFPDMLWSRPETRRHAGKLLIIGGSGYEFKQPANAYGDALEAGIGSAKVLLPASMQKVVQELFPEAEFAPSTPSGSFARSALDQAIDLAEWADGVLFAGDLGRNSETSIVLESFIEKYDRQVTLTHDVIEYCLANPHGCLQRPETTLVLTMPQLQKLGMAAKLPAAFTSDMQLLQLVEQLHDLSATHAANLIVVHGQTVVVASGGEVSTTTMNEPSPSSIAAHAAVWWLQAPGQTFQTLTTSLLGA